MSWRDLPLGRVWTSISKHGLKAGLQDSLARWSQQRFRKAPDVMGDYGWILNADCPAKAKPPQAGPLKINWLIPSVTEGSGGLLGIFRAIYQLEKWGHQHRIYVVGRNPLNAERSTELARKQYFPMQARIELFEGSVADSDALVSTFWGTAYTARRLSNTARKFYFVQDLEYLFYPPGSLYEFTRQTYRWGFYGITLGRWIANVLQEEFGMECSPFGFSYDREIYSPEGKVHPTHGKKRVLFYARPTTERRGFELGVLALALVAKKRPDLEFVLVGFAPGPIQLPFHAVLPGVVPPAELATWYRSSTVSLVLSHTNPSLLPLELMACGCPMVSNAGPNVEWLLTNDTTQLAKPTPEDLANAVLLLLDQEEIRASKIAAGLAFAQHTDWTAEIRNIESAFYRGLNMEALVQPRP